VMSDEVRDELLTAVAELRSHGVGISARDVGPGIEGLRQLARLSPDHAWLDPTLTRSLGNSFAGHSVAATVTACAEEAGSRVVAEGVASETQLEALMALRIPMASGPLFARSVDDLEPSPEPPTSLPSARSRARSRSGRLRADASGENKGRSSRRRGGGRR
jgi:EAL domain-containing protein (putative c-di-GMP-specific phosphodiesterase class I)